MIYGWQVTWRTKQSLASVTDREDGHKLPCKLSQLCFREAKLWASLTLQPSRETFLGLNQLKTIKLLKPFNLWLRAVVSLELCFFSFKLLRELFNPPLESKRSWKLWHPAASDLLLNCGTHRSGRRSVMKTLGRHEGKKFQSCEPRPKSHTCFSKVFQRPYLRKLKLQSPIQICPPPPYWGKLDYCFSLCWLGLCKVKRDPSVKTLRDSSRELQKCSRSFRSLIYPRKAPFPQSSSE